MYLAATTKTKHAIAKCFIAESSRCQSATCRRAIVGREAATVEGPVLFGCCVFVAEHQDLAPCVEVESPTDLCQRRLQLAFQVHLPSILRNDQVRGARGCQKLVELFQVVNSRDFPSGVEDHAV